MYANLQSVRATIAAHITSETDSKQILHILVAVRRLTQTYSLFQIKLKLEKKYIRYEFSTFRKKQNLLRVEWGRVWWCGGQVSWSVLWCGGEVFIQSGRFRRLQQRSSLATCCCRSCRGSCWGRQIRPLMKMGSFPTFLLIWGQFLQVGATQNFLNLSSYFGFRPLTL